MWKCMYYDLKGAHYELVKVWDQNRKWKVLIKFVRIRFFKYLFKNLIEDFFLFYIWGLFFVVIATTACTEV